MFHTVDKIQLLNGGIALVAFFLNAHAFARLRLISSKKYELFSLGLGIMLLWYAMVNLTVAFGILIPNVTELTKFYRWGFWVLVGTLGGTLHFAADKKVR